MTLSEQYYSDFCDYIFKNRPHVIGHFDLITKFDEAKALLRDVGFEYIYALYDGEF